LIYISDITKIAIVPEHIRKFMRDVGALRGVVIAGLPGAGGYDAGFVLCQKGFNLNDSIISLATSNQLEISTVPMIIKGKWG
jgi:phosphomevalonate kinase